MHAVRPGVNFPLPLLLRTGKQQPTVPSTCQLFSTRRFGDDVSAVAEAIRLYNVLARSGDELNDFVLRKGSRVLYEHVWRAADDMVAIG